MSQVLLDVLILSIPTLNFNDNITTAPVQLTIYKIEGTFKQLFNVLKLKSCDIFER